MSWSCSTCRLILTILPVIVGISEASGKAIPPLVSRLGSSLRTRTLAPTGSIVSNVFFLVVMNTASNLGRGNAGLMEVGESKGFGIYYGAKYPWHRSPFAKLMTFWTCNTR